MRRGLFLTALLMLCIACMLPAQAAGSATLYLTASSGTASPGDEIELSMVLSADNLGGLQTEITWDSGYVTYVEGSASFEGSFAQNAAIAQFNAQNGCIRLVYGNTQGYSASDETIFTARFRVNDAAEGWMEFGLSNTKISDASLGVSPMETSSWGTSVEITPFNAGTAWMYLNLRDYDQYYPKVGETVEMFLSLSSSGPAIGSVQGVIRYDPDVLELTNATFTDEAEKAAFTKSLNTAADGRIPFVYAAMSGCPFELINLTFKVIGDGNGYTYLDIADAKATNNETDKLSAMECWPNGQNLYPQGKIQRVAYTLSLSSDTKCSDDDVAVFLSADGEILGGMQATLTYDPAQMEYVAGSAAFLSSFGQSADVKMINDGVAGQIQLLYANSAGYQPDSSSIFTARFRLLSTKESITPVLLSGIKTTNAGQSDVQVIESSFSNGIDWSYALHTPEADKAVAPDCTNTGLTEGKHCSVCGEVLAAQQVVPAKGHTEVTDKAVAPDCTNTGLTEGKHCSVCGEVLAAQQVVSAKGHTEVTDTAVLPDCTNTGLTEGKHCSVCGEVLAAQQVVPAKGHTEVTDKAVAPDCTNTGLTEGKHCSVCGEVLAAQQVVPAEGHSEVTDTAVLPDCTNTGLTEGKHCSVCGEVLAAQQVVPAKSHTWDDGKITREPTAAEEGVKTFTCKACGGTYTEYIPALPQSRLPGDADENGAVNILDALVTLQYSVGWTVSINTSNANVNGDGQVNILDALLILQYSVGWNVKLL